jgi:hypothetical protein
MGKRSGDRFINLVKRTYGVLPQGCYMYFEDDIRGRAY